MEEKVVKESNLAIPNVQPESQDVPQPVTATTSSTSKSPNKRGLYLGIFILLTAMVAITAILFYFSNRWATFPSDDTQSLGQTKPEQVSNTTVTTNGSSHPIAYLKDNYKSVHFYNSDQRVEELGIAELENETDPLIQLGPWSPNGQYLPILAHTGSDKRYVSLYLYDSQKLKAKKIYGSPLNEENLMWVGTSFNFLSTWMDDTRLVVESDRDIQNGVTTLTYITTSGELKTEQQPDRLRQVSNQLEYITRIGRVPQIESIKVGSTTLDFIPEGEIIGVVDGMLAILKRPESLSLGVDDAGNAANPQDLEYFQKEMEKLKEEGLSEEELQEKTLELMEPKGEIILSLYDLKDGKTNNNVNLTEGTWQTRSMLVHPSQGLLIAHQTDRSFLPSKQRFITITPSKTPSTQVIFEEKLPKSENPNYLSLLMFQGSSFFLSKDGNWIIGMRGSGVDNPQSSTVFMKNITNGEELVVCPSHCFDVRVYYPLQLQRMY